MKPYPFSLLNHFTAPWAIVLLLLCWVTSPAHAGPRVGLVSTVRQRSAGRLPRSGVLRDQFVTSPGQPSPAASKAAAEAGMVAPGRTTDETASSVLRPSPVLKTTVSASGS